jgi:hypothetical protein
MDFYLAALGTKGTIAWKSKTKLLTACSPAFWRLDHSVGGKTGNRNEARIMADPKNHAIVEIVETADKVAGGADSANSAFRAISASEAFRKYNWLTSQPGLNSVGDLRGMVVSARWRTAFNIAGDAGEVLGRVALVAALAGNIVKASKEIDAIVSSNASWSEKGARLSTQVSSVAIRTVGGVVPAGFEMVAFSLQGYCQLGGVVSGQSFDPRACVSNLKAATKYVNTTFDHFTDGNNIYQFINIYLVR